MKENRLFRITLKQCNHLTGNKEKVCEYLGVVDMQSELSKYNMIKINHPLDLETDEIICGALTTSSNDIIITNKASANDLENWKNKYEEFHNSIIEEKGYDSCELNVNEVYI